METGPRLKISSDRLVKPGIEPATSCLLRERRYIDICWVGPLISGSNWRVLYNKRLVILIKHCHVEYGYTYYTPRPSCIPLICRISIHSFLFFQSESKTM